MMIPAFGDRGAMLADVRSALVKLGFSLAQITDGHNPPYFLAARGDVVHRFETLANVFDLVRSAKAPFLKE